MRRKGEEDREHGKGVRKVEGKSSSRRKRCKEDTKTSMRSMTRSQHRKAG